MRGQVFTLDILAALVILTVVLGYFTYEFEKVSARAADVEYMKMQTLASDVANIGAKTTFAVEDYPNYVKAANFQTYANLVDDMFGAYNGNITFGSLSRTIGSGCGLSSNVASARRLLYEGPASKAGWLEVQVCQ